MAASGGLARLSAWRPGAWRFPGLFFWAAVWLCLLVLLPVLQGFSALASPLPEQWAQVRPLLPGLFFNSFGLVAGVVLGSGLLGTGLAWLVGLFDFPGRRFFNWALLLPLAMPAYVLGFTLIGLFDVDGPGYAAWLALQGESAGPPPFRSIGGLILSLSLSFYPYVYVSARYAFQTRSGGAMEIARSLGMGGAGAFFRVGLPVALPWIGAGLALAAMETLADVGTVTVFRYETLATAIYQAWAASSASLATAARLAGFLLLPALVVLVLEQWFRHRQGRRAPPGPRLAKPAGLSEPLGWCAAVGAALVLGSAFVIPAWQLLIWSAEVAVDELDWRLAGYAWHTLLVACFGAVLVVATASTLSLAKCRHKGAVLGFLTQFARLGHGLPGAVLAVGLAVSAAALDDRLAAFSQSQFHVDPSPIVGGGLCALLLAYVVRFLATGFGPADHAFRRFTPSLAESARSLGVHGFALWQELHFPLLRGGLLSAFLLAFIEMVKELPIILLMRPEGWDTLAVRVFATARAGEWHRAALPALVLVLLVLAGLLIHIFLGRRAENRHA